MDQCTAPITVNESFARVSTSGFGLNFLTWRLHLTGEETKWSSLVLCQLRWTKWGKGVLWVKGKGAYEKSAQMAQRKVGDWVLGRIWKWKLSVLQKEQHKWE
ncbi:NIPA-like protein 3 [Platysternon megacephalum]|uniref:NIPA-like protein 3 n=1 Tax=Platysternon megacephalum TaxID=55544 RepID=A0A4D9F638_9SAUR|nr:NIPA-like protein 3 [Platysternon megacephalum]